MTSTELATLLAAARDLLPQNMDWEMMNQVPKGFSGGFGKSLDPSIPDPYQDYLKTANGGIFGRIVLFDAKSAPLSQFYAETPPGAPVPLGQDEWYCIGKVNEDPLFMRRADQSVWGFPDRGVVWSQSPDFEQWSKDLDGFLLEYVFGPGYARITGADDTDPWSQVRRELGRAAGES
ncbi:hypothetical protein [Streptomyces sp. NPDC090022]|uniref:hypothetical protein n=1 Tax=Streptomyces sp. NPDC090022 TaxID=3365920 RepID=UPI0038284605